MPRFYFSKLVRYYSRLWLLTLVVCFSGSASSADLTEYDIKAGFIYNFATFVQWPKEVTDTLNLCVYGENPFADKLRNLHGKKVGERQIHIMGNTDRSNIRNCHILYFAKAIKPELPELLKILKGKPVLTIADVAGATHSGVILNMIIRKNKITFEANLKSARANNLQINSRLLSMAKEVI